MLDEQEHTKRVRMTDFEHEGEDTVVNQRVLIHWVTL